VLYLQPREYYDDEMLGSEILDNGIWNIGQFDPVDLQKVQRVSLEGVYLDSELDLVSSALRLFTGVKELFFVEMNLNWTWMGSADESGEMEEVEGESSQWGWVECGEIDIMIDNSRSTWIRSILNGDGCENRRFLDYKREQGGNARGYFAELEKKVNQELMEARDEVVGHGGITSWEIPAVKFVHVGTMRLVKKLLDMRNQYWCRKEEERKQWE